MLVYLLAQGSRVLAGEPGYDHIEQVAFVAQFLAQAEITDVELTEIEVKNRDEDDKNTASDFLNYARECAIDEISAVSSSKRSLPISVKWDCGRYIEINGKPTYEVRKASFWIEQGRITKIAFGDGDPLVIPSTFRNPPNNRNLPR